MRPLRHPILAGAALLACAGAAGTPLAAQGPDLRAEATVGSEAERYLRVLQVAGKAPLYPWSVRGFSPAEVERLIPADSAHPWASRAGPPPPAPDERQMDIRLLRPRAELGFNSALPGGSNDGAVWAGRGITAVGSAGVRVVAGPLSLRLEPLAFWTQNRSFAMVPNGLRLVDSLMYRNARSPTTLDYPQRFGDGSFGDVDPGQSSLRLDLLGVAASFSTANQQWGPAIDQPLMLGANAGGFPHGFIGTSSPWKIGIGRVHGRIMWGSLQQTEWSPLQLGTFPSVNPDHGSRRFSSGIVGVFLPWGLDGLEVGIARFYHQPWPADGLDLGDLPRPLEAFWRNSLRFPDEYDVNQLATAFVRWVLPRGGVEVYGEYAREDHNYDFLDAILEPDRSSGYMIGGRKVWGDARRLMSFRAEWVDTQPGHLDQASNQAPGLYGNSSLTQGHTYRGQLLGSIAGYGGGGSVVGLDAYTPRGRLGADWTRTRLRSPRTIRGEAYGVHVAHSLGAEAVAFRGPVDLVARLRGTLELNRLPGEDVFNVTAALGARLGF